MNKTLIFEKNETAQESMKSDAFMFGLLMLCIWFSHSMGGGWWTFFTTTLFLILLSAKTTSSKWVKLTTKEEAIAWAHSLPDETLPDNALAKPDAH